MSKFNIDVGMGCHETDWFRRGIAEAIYITTERPTLNRDRGRYSLPFIYSQLLSSRDTYLSNNQESCDNMEASVCWRRLDIMGRKLRTFKDFFAGV